MDSKPLRSGPVVWMAIIAATCLLLVIFQQMLWPVVPALLGLLIYYLLYSPMHWLIYRGTSRTAAASWVTVLFLVSMVAFGFAMTPLLAAQFSDGQVVVRYLDGGVQLLERSLRGLESSWRVLREARLAETTTARLTHGMGGMSEHLEPAVKGVVAWATSLLLAPFLAFFFLRDGDSFGRFVGAAVPNAFFERTLYLFYGVDQTLRAYFQGLLKLTLLDTVTLALGLWVMGFPGAFLLAFICAVLAWIPYVGSIAGGILVVLVAATDFPGNSAMAYWAIALFVGVRLLDDFVYMPLTIGRSLHMHPLITVVMIFVGGAIAGVAGLMLVLPLLGVVRVIGETLGQLLTDQRLRARHRHALALRRQAVESDLRLDR